MTQANLLHAISIYLIILSFYHHYSQLKRRTHGKQIDFSSTPVCPNTCWLTMQIRFEIWCLPHLHLQSF